MSDNSPLTVDQTIIKEFHDKIKSLPLYENYDLRTDDKFLTRFLKAFDMDISKSVKGYKAYYEMLIDLPRSKDFISGKEEDRKWFYETLAKIEKDAKEKHNLDYPMFAYYGKDQKNRAIIGMDGSASSPFISYPNFLDASIYGTVLVFDYILEKFDYCQDNGFVMIDDWEKFNAKMMSFYMKHPNFMKTFNTIISGAMPLRADAMKNRS